MPWYRIHGAMVHMRGTKLPAACQARETTSNPNVPPRLCLAPSAYLCDWPIDTGMPNAADPGLRTCSAPICAEHARQVGPDRHYCPRHTAQWLAREPECF